MNGLKELGEFLKSVEVEEFKAEPFYEPHTDSLILYTEDCPAYSRQLSPTVTVFLSDEDNRLVGVEINGVSGIMEAGKQV